MSLRVCLIVTDTGWQEIAAILAQVKHKAGSPPKQSDRMFIEAVLYVARTGNPWRDLPEEFGAWSAVYNRFRRTEENLRVNFLSTVCYNPYYKLTSNLADV